MADPTTIEWLLGGDAAVRWQVMRDLLDERDHVIADERARVATALIRRVFLDHSIPGSQWSMRQATSVPVLVSDVSGRGLKL